MIDDARTQLPYTADTQDRLVSFRGGSGNETRDRLGAYAKIPIPVPTSIVVLQICAACSVISHATVILVEPVLVHATLRKMCLDHLHIGAIPTAG